MISKAIQVLKAKRIFTDVAREVQATKTSHLGSAGPGQLLRRVLNTGKSCSIPRNMAIEEKGDQLLDFTIPDWIGGRSLKSSGPSCKANRGFDLTYLAFQVISPCISSLTYSESPTLF